MEEKERLEKIKFNLTIDQIEELLTELGGNPHRQNDILISKTICHCGENHKLFYYDNTKLFRCYTECSDTFDIFQLIIKIQKINGNDNYSLPQAYKYVLKFFNIIDENDDTFPTDADKLLDWKILEKYKKNNIKEKEPPSRIELKTFDDSILSRLPHPRILPWEKEGITQEIIYRYNIAYNPSSQAIVVPHYNEENKLVGIRERTLIKENEQFGKYRPSIINHQMYNHPLGFNLYNLNNSKNNIKTIKKAIVFEGEKSCLLYASYFGSNNDISVAVCGSSLGSYQMSLLLALGVEEVIIAFDKQFQKIGDNEWTNWTKKLTDINKKYGDLVQISFIFDKWDLLGYKDSPIDRSKDTFLDLFKKRIKI